MAIDQTRWPWTEIAPPKPHPLVAFGVVSDRSPASLHPGFYELGFIEAVANPDNGVAGRASLGAAVGGQIVHVSKHDKLGNGLSFVPMYRGKATNLRTRLNSHWRDSSSDFVREHRDDLHVRFMAMPLEDAEEVEALMIIAYGYDWDDKSGRLKRALWNKRNEWRAMSRRL